MAFTHCGPIGADRRLGAAFRRSHEGESAKGRIVCDDGSAHPMSHLRDTMSAVRRFAATPLGLAALALSLVLVVFLAGRLASAALSADVRSFDAGYLATVAGIVVGVPIAVAVALWQQRMAQDEDRDAEEIRRSTVLQLIADDLKDARAEILVRIPDRSLQSVAPFLGSGLYPTLQASGDLQLIRDPLVLRVISRAYDRIAVTAYLEQQAWETFHNPQAHLATSPPQMLIQRTRAHVASQDIHSKAAIDVALLAITGVDPNTLGHSSGDHATATDA